VGLFKKGKIWWFIKQYKGRRVEESLGTENKKLAERLYAETLPKIIDGSYFVAKSIEITFKELSEHYKERHNKQRDDASLKHLLPFFGNMLITEIDLTDVENYIEDRLSAGSAHSTVYKEFALARRMFNVARKKWQREYGVKWNPFADAGFPSFSNERDRWLTTEEEDRLLKTASPEWLKDVILFAIHTGCRRGEILSTNVKYIDMRRRVISVQANKGGNKKAIPVSERLYDMLQKRLKVGSVSGKLFDVTVSALKDGFDRAVENAGIKNLHFHDLRHTFATRLVQMGVDLYKVQKLMGHRTIRMTERYAHHTPESLKPAAIALDNYYNFTTVADDSNIGMSQNVVKCLINQ